MRTIIVEVAKSGTTLQLRLRAETSSGQAVLVLSDGLELSGEAGPGTPAAPKLNTYRSESGFHPAASPRRLLSRYF